MTYSRGAADAGREQAGTMLDLLELMPEVWRGKSILRAWMERQLRRTAADGLILDLGGGGSRNAHRMRLGTKAKVLTADIRAGAGPTFVGDCQGAVPLRESGIDLVLLLNVLEHVYDYRAALIEAKRVLRPGGDLLLYVPFLYEHHTATYAGAFVDDYFRYSSGALRRLLVDDVGFSDPVQLLVCAAGPATAAASLLSSSLPHVTLRAAAHWCALAYDRMTYGRVSRIVGPGRSEWPLAYWVRATK